MSIYGLPLLLFKVVPSGVDDMADSYYPFDFFKGASIAALTQRIGYNRIDTLRSLAGDGEIDDTELMTIKNGDEVSDYQIPSGTTTYVILTLDAKTNPAVRSAKVYTGPTADSLTGATELFDTADLEYEDSWASVNTKITTFLIKFDTASDFIIIENTSGASSREIDIHDIIAVEVTN